MQASRIDDTIRAAEISPRSALNGDCGAIARAIRSVFGGEYVVVFNEFGQQSHATVRINGDLYDGTGRKSPESLVAYYAGREEFEGGRTLSIDNCEYFAVQETLPGFKDQPQLTYELETAFFSA